MPPARVQLARYATKVDARASWLAMFLHVRDDISSLHVERLLWKEVSGAMLEASPDAPDLWLAHYARLYLAAQAMTLRRLVRAKTGEASFCKLLEQVERAADLVAHCGMQDPVTEAKKARALLNDLSRPVIDWATATIAHRNMDPPHSPTWTRLDQAIDGVSALYVEWTRFVTGMEHDLDVVLPPNWPVAFARPLYRLTAEGWRRGVPAV